VPIETKEEMRGRKKEGPGIQESKNSLVPVKPRISRKKSRPCHLKETSLDRSLLGKARSGLPTTLLRDPGHLRGRCVERHGTEGKNGLSHLEHRPCAGGKREIFLSSVQAGGLVDLAWGGRGGGLKLYE